MDEADFLTEMRAAPGDAGPRLVYADWLLARGDARGELIILDELEHAGELTTLAQLDRLLALVSEHGFPKLPDDPCAGILCFTGGGSYPVQYDLDHGGHSYYLRWRYGFSIDVDNVTVLEGDLDTLTTNEWTFRETTAILAIVSAAIVSGQPLATLVFPDQAGFQAHPHFQLGRAPHYSFPDGLYDQRRVLEVRDFGRWHLLWKRRLHLAGIPPAAPKRVLRCDCDVLGLTCGVPGCDRSQPA